MNSVQYLFQPRFMNQLLTHNGRLTCIWMVRGLQFWNSMSQKQEHVDVNVVHEAFEIIFGV
jgi:hypothetical protein